MEIKIGVLHTPREIVLESGQPIEEVERAIQDALTGGGELLTLVDERGRKIIVPSDRVAYIEIGEQNHRRVGFGAL